MTTLFWIEIRRFLARRIVRTAGLLALAAILITGIVVLARSHRPDPDELQAGQQQARLERLAEIDACARGDFHIPEEDIPPGMTLAQFCEQVVIGEFTPEDPRFHLTAVADVLTGTSGIVIVLLMVLGASSIGAEWHAGTIATFLTWEPRRVRAFVAKVLAAVVFAILAFLAVQALLAAALIPAAALRGTTEGADLTWLRSMTGLQLRAAFMAGVAAAIGLSLASIGRNTAVALGAGFVYFSILEPFLRVVRPGWQQWFLSDNVAAFVSGDAQGFISGRSVVEAALLVSAYAVGLVLVATEMFRRRDVA